jgi:hypothetical protein
MASIKRLGPGLGRSFLLEPSKTMDNGHHYPAFNTLLLFLRTPTLVHASTPVAENAKGKRLALGGCCSAGGKKDNMCKKLWG